MHPTDTWPSLAINAISFLCGLLTTLIAGKFVTNVLRFVTVGESPAMSEPSENTGNQMLGWLERIVFFGSFWARAETLVAGWLVFKVGSKWEAWQNIMKVPQENMVPGDILANVRFRHAWGSRLLQRFLLGTLYNILCGLLGVMVGVVCKRALPFILGG